MVEGLWRSPVIKKGLGLHIGGDVEATLLICKRIYSRSASISLTLLVTCTTFLPPRWRRRTEKGVASSWAAC
jgi:hypothetical protein